MNTKGEHIHSPNKCTLPGMEIPEWKEYNVNKLKLMEYTATGLSISGAILNAFMLWFGFVIWILGNIFWIYVGKEKGLKGMVLAFSVYTLTSILGLYVWVFT